MKKKSNSKSKKKVSWFSSTLKVLLIVFLVAVVVGIWFYGWRKVIDESLFYIIGASFTGLVITIVGLILKKRNIKLW